MNTTPRSERARRTAKPLPKKQKTFSKRSVIPMLVLFGAILALLVIVSPKEPQTRAVATVATQDGHVVSTAAASTYDGLVISEVMGANQAAVPDEKGEFSDYIEIWNSSAAPIPLKNVGLSNDGTRIRFIFPDISLGADERVVVFCSNSNQQDPSKPFHAKFKISSIGTTVFLFDPNAFTIDSVVTPIMNSDASYSLMADGTFEMTEFYSPGYENTEAGFLAYRNGSRINDGAIVINEIMADAKSNLLLDEDGETVDWVELYNRTNEPFPLKDLFLSNKENKPLKWRFPDDAVIPAGGYYVVFCSGKDRLPGAADGIAHTNFKISAERDVVLLSDSRGRLVDRIAIDNMPADHSYGRNESDHFQTFSVATPGLPNTAAGAAIADKHLRAQNPIGVYITEVMASNNAVVITQNTGTTDAVELYNASNETQLLEGFALSDDVSRPRKWQFPSGAAISPNSYLVVYLDGKPELTTGGQYHTNFKLLRTGGETICFSSPEGLVLDKIDLPLIPTNVSYGRTEGLNGFFYYDVPTLGAANSTGFYGYADAPSFSLRGGLYYEPVTVTLNVPEGTSVYYSTDGAIPTMNHTRYEGEAITMQFTSVLRARAFKEDLQPSDVVTQSYFINAFHTLPIISISIDPDELYNEANGIFVVGPNINKDKRPYRSTVYGEFGKIPRPCYAEYYSLDNQVVFAQGLEMSLSGGFSLDYPQKSLKFRAKSLYGSKIIDAPLFDDRDFTQYKSFTLRMGGSDGLWTRLLDGFQSRMVDDIGTVVPHQAWDPVVVYINGVYWGHYNLRERKDRYFVAQHEGLPLSEADNMDISLGNGRAEYGSSTPYNNLIKKAKTLSPGKSEEDYQYLVEQVDIENIIDFFSFQMFFGNTDLGNVQIYKLRGEGQKFKWILFDLDYGLFQSDINSPRSLLKEGGMGSDNVDNTVFRKLMENEGFRDQYLTRFGEIFQFFTTDYMIAKLDTLVPLIQPEMKVHFARWAEFTDKLIHSEGPMTPEAAYRYWEGRITRLKNTLRKRPTILYDYVQEWFKLSNDQMVHYLGARPPMPPDAN